MLDVSRALARSASGWPVILASWFLLLVVLPEMRNWAPASWWYVVGEVRVDDTVVGEDPVVTFTREITMDEATRGEYKAKITDTSGFVVCLQSATLNYSPRKRSQQSRLLLKYWLGYRANQTPGAVCDVWPLPAGRYCLETLWTFYPVGYPPKTVSHPPACFNVRQPGAAR